MSDRKPEKFISAWGVIEWRLDGDLHCDDGPAMVFPDGTKLYYSNGLLHRDGGEPAIECPNGYKVWYDHGRPYHSEGPREPRERESA